MGMCITYCYCYCYCYRCWSTNHQLRYFSSHQLYHNGEVQHQLAAITDQALHKSTATQSKEATNVAKTHATCGTTGLTNYGHEPVGAPTTSSWPIPRALKHVPTNEKCMNSPSLPTHQITHTARRKVRTDVGTSPTEQYRRDYTHMPILKW